MRKASLVLTLPFVTLAATAQEHRELEAHVHGVGEVNLAIDGTHLLVELHAPGMDIVGFEHAAGSEADREAVAGALERLERAASVLTLPRSAGCEMETASVDLHGETELHEHDEVHAHAEAHDHEDEHAEHHDDSHEHGDDRGHTEFEASYLFDCAAIENLTSITFSYFDQFAPEAELRVQVVGPAGASAFTVTARNPEVDLPDLI